MTSYIIDASCCSCAKLFGYIIYKGQSNLLELFAWVVLNSMRWAVSLSTRSGIDGKMLNHHLWSIIASGLRSDRISQPFSGVARYNPGGDLRRNHTLLVVTQSYLQGSVGATALGRTVCGAAVERDLVPRRTKKVRKGRAWSHLHNFSQFSACSLPTEMTRTFQLLSNWSQEQFQNASSIYGKQDVLPAFTNLCACEGPASTDQLHLYSVAFLCSSRDLQAEVELVLPDTSQLSGCGQLQFTSALISSVCH